MKKIILVIAVGMISNLSFANQALPLQYGVPEPMGAPVSTIEANHTQSKYNNLPTSPYSIAVGFSGARLSFDNQDSEDEKFKGFFLNGMLNYDKKTSIWAEYTHQTGDDSELDLDEVSVGVQYKFYEDAQIYGAAGLGLGYAWMKEDFYDEEFEEKVKFDLKYLSIPVSLEAGYKLNNQISTFANVGYKWLINTDGKVCSGDECVSDSSSDLNLDGFTYKVGVRYHF